jgi:hypothetical protein
MYRVLLKSMNLVCSGCQEGKTHDGAAVKAGDRKQNENRAWNRTYLIGLSSTIDPDLGGRVLPPEPRYFYALHRLNSQYYLGIGTPRRNNAPSTPKATPQRNFPMTTFDKREEAFEKKFALDEEQKFKAEARRNRLLGLWAAEKLGVTGDAATAYAREAIGGAFAEGGNAAIAARVAADLSAQGITENEIRARMTELLLQEIAQVKAGA